MIEIVKLRFSDTISEFLFHPGFYTNRGAMCRFTASCRAVGRYDIVEQLNVQHLFAKGSLT